MCTRAWREKAVRKWRKMRITRKRYGVHRRSRAGGCHEGQGGVLDHQGRVRGEGAGMPVQAWPEQRLICLKFFLLLYFDIIRVPTLPTLPAGAKNILRCGHYCVYGQIKSTTFGQLEQCFYGGQLLSQSNM